MDIPRQTTSDTLDRPLRDLRISVTDRCNFRCTYCMPRELFGADHPFLPRSDLLSFEEITRLARLSANLGVTKIRLTGGEPLLRKELEKLIAQLAAIPGIRDIALTTNGSALTAARARTLARAGLNRLTVSLDALHDDTFRAINDADFPVARVLEAIDHAEAAGLGPIKINTVVQRGRNEQEILPLAEHFRGTGHIVRFIEYMDVGNSNGWRLDAVVPAREIIDRIHAEWPLEAQPAHYPGEVANRWTYRDGRGEIGVIASVTQPFCGGCTRLRLSAEGRIYTCLFAGQGLDLREPLRQGATDDDLRERIGGRWLQRNDRYSELRSSRTRSLPKVEMSYIGG